MAKKQKNEPPRRLLQVPDYVRDPDQLQALCFMADLEPAMLLATVEQDYTHIQPMAHPAVYEARGAEKGGLMILILQHCKELAEGFEREKDGDAQLSRTLQHVQAQLAVLLADYEQQLRQVHQAGQLPGAHV